MMEEGPGEQVVCCKFLLEKEKEEVGEYWHSGPHFCPLTVCCVKKKVRFNIPARDSLAAPSRETQLASTSPQQFRVICVNITNTAVISWL
jgi:hypothetical protein